MTTQLFTAFLRLLAFAGTLLLLAAGLESASVATLPPGTFLCLFEVLLGISAAIWTLRSKIPFKTGFGLAVLSIAVADGLFYVFNYLLAANISQDTSSAAASAFYGLGFLSAAIALSGVARIEWRSAWKKLLVPSGIILITVLFYFLPVMFKSKEGDSNVLMWTIQMLVLIFAIGVGVIALTLLIHSMNPFLVFFSLGFTILPLLCFSISSEIFVQGNLSFGFYEYFWAFGCFLAEGALFFLSDHLRSKSDPRLDLVSRDSIGVQYKTAIITAVLVALVGASVFSSEVSIRFVTFGIVAAMVFAVVISSFTVEAVSRYSSLLGKYLQHGFTSSGTGANRLIERLPVELEVLFSAVFSQALERERERQQKANRFNDLHQKFAHDIRSPLQALSNLLAQGNLREDELKRACLESVQSMSRASQRILEDLGSDSNDLNKTLSMPAIDAPELVKRAIRIFEAMQKIPVRLDVEPSCRYAWMEESALERLILNILSNSAESPGVQQIRVSLRRAGDRTQIEVQDDGSGAPAEILRQLNEGEAVTTKPDGHGIGLSAHREVLSRFDGGLRFESESGRYFRSTISLHRAPDHLVLIDDDRAIHLAWKALARARNVSIETHGPEGDLLSRLQPHLASDTEIHVDYHLGHSSGVDLLRKLSSAGFRNLVLVTSDEVSPEISANWRVRDKTFPRA